MGPGGRETGRRAILSGMTESRGFWHRIFGDRENRRRQEGFQQKDWETTAEACRAILAADPYNRKALHDLVVAAWRLGRADEAYEACRRLCLLDSGRSPEEDPVAQAAELLAKAETGEVSHRYTQHLPVLAELLAARGRPDLGEALLATLVSLPEAFPRAAAALAGLRASRGDLPGVEALLAKLRRGPALFRDELLGKLETLAEQRPTDLALARVRAVILADAGRLAETEKDMAARLALDGSDRAALALTAACRLAGGNAAGAAEHFRTWINLHPADEAGYQGLALTARAEGDARMEARALRQLARRFPHKAGEALERLRETVADPDTDPELAGHMAALLLAEGDLDRAREAYRKVFQAAPADQAVSRQWQLLEELATLRRIAEHKLLLDPTGTAPAVPASVPVRFQGRIIPLNPSREFLRLRQPLDPGRIRLNLARMLLDRDRQESMGLLQRVLRESPALRHAALYLLGVAFLEEGYRAPAHRAFAAVDPALPGLPPEERVQVLYDLALRAEEQGWLNTAHQALAALLVLDYDYADARARYDRVQAQLAAAPRERERPAQELPTRERLEVLYRAGREYEDHGDTENALRAYEDVLLLDVGFGDVRERFDRLARQGTTPGVRKPGLDEERFTGRTLLGKGGMGMVYKAFDRRLRRDVAIKVVNERYSADPVALARFRREAHAAAALPPHPSVVGVHDILEDGELAIVLELVPGESLRGILNREGALSEARALGIAARIAEGLGHAHKHGVIHRDVKPDNVLVARGNIVKLTDFGLAHLDTATALTTLGEVMGTSLYMPPEQIRGLKVDARSDIYSLGVTIYEMLAGSVPFAEGDVAFRHVFEEPESPRRRNPAVRPATEALVLRCLAKDPQKRYQDCGSLLAELRRLLTPAAS